MSRIGSIAAAPFVGDQFASVYLGATRVPTVPGKPVIINSAWTGSATVVVRPQNIQNDGGSSVTSYRYYFNGTLITPSNQIPAGGNITAVFPTNRSGQTVRISAVNAIGEGPLSDPATVEEA